MTKNISPKLVYPVNNGYVNDLRPTIQGTGMPRAIINGKINTETFTANVSDKGVWYYKMENELYDLSENTISFIQYNKDGQTSPQTIVNFKTDTQILYPHTLKFPINNQFLNTNSPIINGTGKPGATIEVNLQDNLYNTVVNSDGNWEIRTENLSEGSLFLNVIQKDMGNISPAICAAFVIDTVSPAEPTVDFPYDQSCINNPKPVFCGKGEPNARIDATVDESRYYAVVNAQGNWSFEVSEALIDDTHIISARQIDLAGNVSPENISVFTIKTVQPSPPEVTNPASGSILSSSNPILTGLGEKDCVIVTRIHNNIYSALVNPDGKWELKISDKLNDGTHTLKIYQVDKAGNISNSIDITIRIDTTIPAAPVILYPEKGKYVNSSNFTIKGTGEPDATVVCSVAGYEYSTRVANDGSWSIDVFDNDNIKYKIDYIITAKQRDIAGNTGRIAKIEFTVDKDSLKAPVVTFPQNSLSINNASPIISGTGKAGATVDVNINKYNYTAKVQNNNTWSISLLNKLPQGENKLTVVQTDFGNVSPTTTVLFNVNLVIPPSPVIISPITNEVIENNSVIIKGRGEAGFKINIKLDDACYTSSVNEFGIWEYTVIGLLQGTHSILVSQTDIAGNESLYAYVNFTSITGQPSLSYSSGPTSYQLIYNPAGPQLTTKTIATLKTSNPITVDNVFGNEFSKIISENGQYEFKYTDSKGNVGNITAGVTWIDNQPPIIQIDNINNNFYSEKTVSYYKYGGSCIKNALVNNMPFESGTRFTEEGFYRIEITDTAGNIATSCFIIDKTPPEATGVENDMIYNNDVIISYSDNLSGIKSALLNGVNILSDSILTENGNYKLTLIDYADNETERFFSINKSRSMR